MLSRFKSTYELSAPCLVTMETVKSYFFLCLVSISCFLDNIYHMRPGHNLSPEAEKANSNLMAKTRDEKYSDRINLFLHRFISGQVFQPF